MGNYSTPTTTRARRPEKGPGNAWDALKRCALCGKTFTPRRRWAMYCCPTCRVRAFDARTGRTRH